MSVSRVKLTALPKSQRKSIVAETEEWKEIQKLLPGLPKDEAIQVSLSPKTIAKFKGKKEKVALAAFRQKLTLEPGFTEKFKVSIIGTELIIKHRVEKSARA
jgi:hypothetical protein